MLLKFASWFGLAWPVAALVGVVMVAGTTGGSATDYTWSGPSGGSWNTPANWGGSGYPNIAGDTAAFSQDFTAAYAVNLNANAVLNSLSVTDTGTGSGNSFTLNNGTGTPTLTLNGPSPTITSALAGGQTLTVNPTLNLTTANAVFSSVGGGNLVLANPGPGFFANLNPVGGLNVATSLRISNATSGIGQLSTMKTGAGSLQLDLAPGSTFFTNQPVIGGTGNRILTGVASVAAANGSPQTLVNNSTGYLDLQLGSASPSTNFFGTLSGLSSGPGKNGTIHIEYIRGTNNLASASFNTSAAGSALNLYGYGSTAASAVLKGGSFNLGNATLGLLGGLTLNVDSNTGPFSVGGLMLSSANSAYFYRGGAVTVNWNASGKTIAGTLGFNNQGGGPAIFNLLGGSLVNGGHVVLGSTSHNYDNSSTYLNLSGGVLSVTGGNTLSMSGVTTGGAQEYSYLTLTNSGTLDLQPGANFYVGARNVASDASATKSEATINLDGGTLRLATPISRQNVSPTTGAGSARVLFYFNGGTMQANGNLAQLFLNFGTMNSGGDGIYVKSGGAVIDCNGFNVGLGNNLVPASGSTGGLTKLGTGTLALSGTNTCTGPTLVAAGVLALGVPNCLDTSSIISLAAGAALDVSAISNYTMSGSTTLAAASAGQSSSIYTAVGGSVSLASRPITLSFDGSNPALVMSQGSLWLGGQTITVNTPLPLANGTYKLIRAVSGTLTHSGSYTLAGSAGTGTIGFSGGEVQMTITGSTRVATTTTLSGDETVLAGSPSTITAVVSPASATGTVQFYLDGVPFGSAVALASGYAPIPSTAALAGYHSITASYSGSATCSPSAVTNAASLIINQYSGGTATAADEADAFELYLVAHQSQYPYNYYFALPGDDASVAGYIATLASNGRFSDIAYPTNPAATVVQGGGGWTQHLPRLFAIYKALITTNSAYFIQANAALVTNLMPKLITATVAYTHAPWDITDQWNYCHIYADLGEVYALGSICLYSRQLNRLVPGLIPVSNIDAWGNRIPDLYRNGHIDTTYMVPHNGTISQAHLQGLVSGANMIWSSQGIMLKYLTQSTNAVRLEGLDTTFDHIWSGCALIGPKHESPTGWPVYTALPQMSLDYMLGEHYTPNLLIYGGSFIGGTAQWRDGMANYPRWAMPPTKRINQNLADCVIQGLAPVTQGYPDRVLRCRDLLGHSPGGGLDSWINLVFNYDYRKSELQQLKTWNNGGNPGTNAWPFANLTFTHFYSSDYSIQHFPHHMITFRGISQRTGGIEGFGDTTFPLMRQVFIPLGASYIYSDGNEYDEVTYASNPRDFDSSCDYTRIPGVTTKTVSDTVLTNAITRYIYGDLPFAGTAAAPNSGVTGWEQSRYVRTDSNRRSAISLPGNRAVFYLDMAVVHLGAGFDNSLDGLPTTTSLDQRLSAYSNIVYGLTNGTTQTIAITQGTPGGVTNAGINWVLYDKVGYLPPSGSVKILRDVQQINGATLQPDERIFSLYVDQSSPVTNNLSFDWAVLPGMDQATLATYGNPANRPWTIITNTAALQAIHVPSEAWLGAVFHGTNSTLYAPGLTVAVSRPTVLLLTLQSNQVATIYAADPYENMVAPYTNTVVPFTNASKLVSQVTVTINSKAFALTLPPWPYLGKTVSATVSLSSTNLAPTIVGQPSAAKTVAGDTATFAVAAAGTPSPAYQWQRNGTNILGATASSYALATKPADNGVSFRCIITNVVGAVTSTPALLTVNDRPTITGMSDQFIAMNTASSPLPFVVNDSFTLPAFLTVTASSSNPALVPNANLDLAGSGSTRYVTITPLTNQTGYATISLTVSDGALSASTNFLVVVKAVSLPPVLAPFANRSLVAGTYLSVASQASDPNTPPQALGFSLPVKPAGAAINGTSGLVAWRPAMSQAGTSNQFKVVVTNTASLAATQSFWVGVLTPQSPVIAAPSVASGRFGLVVSGDAGPDYTIQTATNLPAGNWWTVFSTNSPALPFGWADPDTNSWPRKFYRIQLGP